MMINKHPNQLSEQELQQLRNDKIVRQKLAHSSHLWFFILYMSKYMKYDFAPFHHDMFGLTEDEVLSLVNITAFRGSAKSTIMTLSLPIWAAIGRLQKKFIFLVSQTQTQARLYLANIRRELESNELLKSDIGPFQEINDEWSSGSIVIPKYGVRISAVSTDQSVRGFRHYQHRPDLIILDDIEDLASVKTKEQRDKTYNWVMGDIIPAGDETTKYVIVGNLLDEDSVQMRLANHIQNGEMDGVFRKYPLLDENSIPLWPSRFPNQKSISDLRKKVPSEVAWQREYMLRFVSEIEQVIHRDWIKYYKNELLPSYRSDDFLFAAIGVDMAISQNSAADRTAMISAYVFYADDGIKIYILPNPINERMTFPEMTKTIKQLNGTLAPSEQVYTYIEQVGAQEALVQQLDYEGVEVEGVKVSSDKRVRLALTTQLLKSGVIVFPESGCEELIQQLVGFGKEKYDDLADAFSLLINKIIEDTSSREPQLIIV
jgi:predicted phage terminase large subunit-like protein